MKKKFIFIAVAIALVACSDNLSVNDNQEKQYEETDLIKTEKDVLYSNFSVILSKALASEPSLREFIKAEASKQFDMDYDVFYPLQKDAIVDGQRTFEDILRAYDTNLKMSEIEENLPLLNILVPDWSWARCFCCDIWDTNDSDVCVMFISDNQELPVYSKGRYIGALESGELMLSPILIVGESERVYLKSPETKGEKASYEFIDEAFDGSKREKEVATKVALTYWDRSLTTESIEPIVTAEELDPRVIGAYNEFGNDDYKPQRDYIYYGMTNTISAGKRNPRISEYIYKIKFDSFKGSYYTDDDNDFKKVPSQQNYTRYVAISDKTLQQHFFYTGYLELHFNVIIRNNDGTVAETQKVRSVNFGEVFQLAKVSVAYKHKTWFTDPKWVFSIDFSHPEKNFIPKWYKINIELPSWDIESQSTIMNIQVTEFDPAMVIEKSVSVSSSVTDNFVGDFGASVTVPVGNVQLGGSIKLSYGVTTQSATTSTFKTTRTLGEDDLGTAQIKYTHPIIIRDVTVDNKTQYYIKEHQTGTMSMMILPRYE